MIRKSFVMLLNPNKGDEYKELHDAIWPEVVAEFKDHGVHNYSIFLDRDTDVLFAYVEIESEERWSQLALSSVCKRWWKANADVMQTNDDSSPKSQDLVSVFHLP